ncbi:MAG: endonuclease NucS [Haloplanus sp.]
MVTTLHRPAHRDALYHLEDAFERGDLVTVFGRCTVEYDGRASSSLGPGDRLLVLKPDGSALVHTDEKRTPVNWQPPGCEHFVSVREDGLRVRSVRRNPDEHLDVRFDRVDHLAAYDVTDPDELDLHGSEADLKEHVLAHPDRVEAGFEPLATERETDAGPMDVFGEDADGTPVVVELKRRRVGPSAVGQLRRYVDALGRELGDDAAVRGILVAPSVTDRARGLLDAEGLAFVALDPATGKPPEGAVESGAVSPAGSSVESPGAGGDAAEAEADEDGDGD